MQPLPRSAALVVIDVQKAIDHPQWGRRNNPQAEARIAELLAAWRATGRPIFHIRHDSTFADSPYRAGQAGNEFKPMVAPRAGETVVAKRTNSAFIGTDFEGQIRRAGCDTLVITGVLTNNSVEATARMAGNLGFRTIVVADATAAVAKTGRDGRTWPAEDVHALSLANLDGEYAEIADTADLLRRLES